MESVEWQRKAVKTINRGEGVYEPRPRRFTSSPRRAVPSGDVALSKPPRSRRHSAALPLHVCSPTRTRSATRFGYRWRRGSLR